MGLPADRQAALRATLSAIPDPQERMAVAMAWNNQLDPLLPAERIDQNLIRGCASRVWLAADLRQGRCHFRTDADSPLVRSLVALICGIYNGATPQEILTEPPPALEDLGITRNLSPTRQNGLAAVRQSLIHFASQSPPS